MNTRDLRAYWSHFCLFIGLVGLLGARPLDGGLNFYSHPNRALLNWVLVIQAGFSIVAAFGFFFVTGEEYFEDQVRKLNSKPRNRKMWSAIAVFYAVAGVALIFVDIYALRRGDPTDQLPYTAPLILGLGAVSFSFGRVQWKLARSFQAKIPVTQD